VHGDDHTCLVGPANLDRVSSALPAEFKTESLGDAHHVLRGGHRQLGSHAGISMGLMRMSSSGTGRPSSTRVSI
jgi:hypothetical protein